MNTKLFLATALGLLSLSGCNSKSDIVFNDREFISKDAVFFSTTTTVDLDDDGSADDSITSISLLIGEKEERDEEPKDLCKLVSQINAAQGDPAPANGTDLIFVQASQLHLNQTNVPFVEGDFLTGGSLTDADGNPLDGAASVTSIIKENVAFFNVFSEGFGTLNLQKLSDDSLNAEFLDAPSILIREGVNNAIEVVETNSSVDGSIKRAKLCPALSTFSPQFIVP